MIFSAQPVSLANQWRRRAERARDLSEEHPSAASVLRFYTNVLAFQGRVAGAIKQSAVTSLPLCGQIDVEAATAVLPDLLSTVEAHAPRQLADAAGSLRQQPESAWRDLLASYLLSPNGENFFARACLQPFAEHLQVQFPDSLDQSARQCPVCSCLPQMVILRPEGEGVSRSLLCSFCLREWGFRRLLCAYCGELDKEKLPSFIAEECKHVRVEACDTCHRYLKSMDLSLDGLAIPLVDEVALAALDIWATQNGYSKIAHNLTGF